MKKHNKLNAFLILLLVSLFSTCVAARTIRVPGDYTYIQDAINAAVDGDTVLLADGEHNDPGRYRIDFWGKAITVTSENGPESCIVGGIYFYFTNAEGPTSILNGMTITDAHRGIWIYEASPWIRNCVIKNCFDETLGGGIKGTRTDATFENCIIRDNQCSEPEYDPYGSDGQGGGIFLYGPEHHPTFISCTIANNNVWDSKAGLNIAGKGGGIYCVSNARFYNCIFQDNNTRNEFELCSNVVFKDCIMNDGIKFRKTNVRISNSAFEYYGLVFHEDTTAHIENSIVFDIFKNYDTYFIACVSGSSLTVDSSSIVSILPRVVNTGFWLDGVSELIITNSIIWGQFEAVERVSPSTVITYSNVIGGFPGEGNINADPLFVTGPDGDYYLSQMEAGQAQDSPCLNAGNQLAEQCEIETSWGASSLDKGSTASDHRLDTGTVDMGYHRLTDRSVRLEMPGHMFHPDDTCLLRAYVENDSEPVTDVPLFVLLEVDGDYWFWDDWTQDPDHVTVNLPAGTQERTIIPAFTWPDTGESSLDGIRFWSALTDQDMSYVLGGNKGIGMWEFGYGP